jgi:threonine synthase
MNRFERVCHDCGAIQRDRGYTEFCDTCGDGLIGYQYPGVNLENVRSTKPHIPHFFQLYRVLPFDTDFESNKNSFDPKLEPVGVIEAENLEKELFPNAEAKIYLADSTRRGGTNSLKDPDATVILYRLHELGFDGFAVASTGDCGASLCYVGSALGMDIHLFVPEDCYDRWSLLEDEIRKGGLIDDERVHIYKQGETMHDAYDAARKFGEENGLPYDFFFNNQLRIEGSKTIHIEVMEYLGGSPDVYIQALGSGTGLFAMQKACKDLSLPLPELVGVQPEGCSPMALAARGKPLQERADTYVMGIGLPKLGPCFRYLQPLGTQFLSVYQGGKAAEKARIEEAIGVLQEAGIPHPGLEASLTVAGVRKIAPEIRDQSNKQGRTLHVVLGITGVLREGDRQSLMN